MEEAGKISQIGGSKMVIIPPYMLKILNLGKDSKIFIKLKGGKIVIEKGE